MRKKKIYSYVQFLREQEEQEEQVEVPVTPDMDTQREAEEKKAETLKDLQKRMQDYKTVKPRLESAFKKAGEDPNYDIEKEVLSIHGGDRRSEDRNPLVTALEQVLRAQLRITRAERKRVEDVNKKTKLEAQLRSVTEYTPDAKDAKLKQDETVARIKDGISELNKSISDNQNITDLKNKFKEAQDSMEELFQKEEERLKSIS
jgi:prefoldin subunit 5